MNNLNNKRIIALDLGSKTLGIAVSDPLLIIAKPYKTLRFEEDDYDKCLNLLLEEIKIIKPLKIILGLPKHMNNDIGIRGNISIDFSNKIKEKINIEVILQDERLTSKQADNLMIEGNLKRKERSKKSDEVAACLILQDYLDKIN